MECLQKSVNAKVLIMASRRRQAFLIPMVYMQSWHAELALMTLTVMPALKMFSLRTKREHSVMHSWTKTPQNSRDKRC